MKRIIGLITIFSIAIGNVYSQTKSKHIEFDTIINGGHFYFQMKEMTRSGTSANVNNRSNYNDIGIFNSAEEERKRKEEEWRAVEDYIDSMRVILFTNIIELTKAEASVFWPAYDNYQSKLDKILKKRSEANSKLCDPFVRYKIKEYIACVDIEVNSYKEEALLREQYAEKFKKILGDKFYLLYRAENLFIRWVYSTF
ncbi:MAG: hypothetical protein LBD76_06010 [Prevotellaceae bacterium]|jgi:primosomal protein N'|nr:hypothetical protein [Prevotellaceae bacterium]